MDAENVEVFGKPSAIPAAYNWESLRRLEGTALENHYRDGATRLELIRVVQAASTISPVHKQLIVDALNG
jgi:hypothetical protein